MTGIRRPGFNPTASSTFSVSREAPPAGVESPSSPRSTRAERTGFSADSSFSATTVRALSTRPPPPPSDTNPEHWRAYCEQFRGAAEKVLSDKRASRFPDDTVQRLARGPHGPVYVGGRANVPGKEGNPVFFQNFPSDRDTKMQLYAFKRDNAWVTFEVAHSFHKAYNDPRFTAGKLGTNSVLGFPDSGRELLRAGGDAHWPPFQRDGEVADALKRGQTVPYQKFENGWLVETAPGKVQAYDVSGRKLGGAFPGGQMVGAVPMGPGSARQPGSVYAPFEVTPGASVNGRLGFHWPVTGLNEAQENQLIERAKAMGAGYTTLLVGGGDNEARQVGPLIRKLQAAGITPVVRLYEPKPADLWTDEDINRMKNASWVLGKELGVKLIQVGNEPNIETWNPVKRGVSHEDYLARSTQRAAEAILRIKEAVGDDVKLGPPPVAAGAPSYTQGDWAHGNYSPQEYFEAQVKALKDLEVRSGRKLVDYLPVHNYDYHDGENTTTTVGGGGARGQLGWGPATSDWYEATAARILGRSVKSLSTEGGAGPDAFRANDAGRVQREMGEVMDQLNQNTGYTASLWLLSESGARDVWDRHTFLHGEGPWGPGLEDYRRAYREAQ